MAATAENSLLLSAAYDRLITFDDDFEVQPQLATSWESEADGREWVFHLRDDVVFWDGTEFTAEDAAYTYQRLIDPETGSEAAGPLSFLDSDGIVAEDPHTLRFITDEPIADLPERLINKNSFIVKAGTSTERLRTEGVGTGPFVPVDFAVGQEPYLLERNADYWDSERPAAPCVTFQTIVEPSTRVAALNSGQVDLVVSVDFINIPELEAQPEIDVIATEPATSMTLSMWTDTPPFDDNRVREALKFAIDRERVLETVFLGYGSVGDDNPLPPGSPYAWRQEARQQDVAEARRLLQEAGYSETDPLEIDFYTSEYLPGATNLAQLFAEMAAEAGVRVNVRSGPADEHWDTVWLKEPFVGSAWAARPPGEALSVAYVEESQVNETHWNNPDYERLLEEARSEFSDERRADLYRQAAQMLSEEGGVIVPVFFSAVAGIRSDCRAYQPHIQTGIYYDFRDVVCDREG